MIPKIADAKMLLAIKSFQISPIKFKNSGGEVLECTVHPVLPLGLILSIENKTVVLSGTPIHASARTVYTITATNADGSGTAIIEITVSEAPIREQRGEIIKRHDTRHDLDTPRSQIENAINDNAIMSSSIKPHEKFAQQPMGDDKRLSQQTANNPDAENRAQSAPENRPAPSAEARNVNVARATPSMTPKPGH